MLVKDDGLRCHPKPMPAKREAAGEIDVVEVDRVLLVHELPLRKRIATEEETTRGRLRDGSWLREIVVEHAVLA